MAQPWFQAWWTAPRFRHLILEGIVAICLAFIIWLYIHGRAKESLDHVPVPVTIQLSAGQRDQFLLDVAGSPRVTASFTGPAARIRDVRRKLQRGQMKVTLEYAVPSGRQQDAVLNDTVSVEPAQLAAPPGVTVELVEATRTIPITVHRVAERTLPVKLEYTGEARVTQLKIEPAQVLVRGPKGVLDRAQAIATLPYAFTTLADDMSDPDLKDQVALATELEGRLVQITPAQVAFRCKVAPRKKLYELRDVPVHFLCPVQFPWRPRFADERHAKITLRLIGPSGDDSPPTMAYVDLTRGTFGRGRNLEPVRLQLPKDFQLADNTPFLVAFELDEADRAAAEVVKP